MQGTRIQELARWVVSVEAIPVKTRLATVNVVADAVAAAIAGYELSGAAAARAAASKIWGEGNCAIWFASRTGSLSNAAFANSMTACILDIDDGHRAACGHPGAAIVPSVLAAAEELGASGERTLIAIAIGYEVGVRVIASLDLRKIDTLVTGRWCGQAIAAAIGWLRGEDADNIAEAMAIAGAVAPYMLVAEYTQVGNHTKEAIPFGAANGVLALTLAVNGFKGPLDILDHESYDGDLIANGDGGRWYVETTYFKPYSCCRWIHAPIDAVLSLREQVNWDDVTDIEVQTFERTLSLNNQLAPTTVQAAQYSTPFCVAAAALKGAECLQPMSEALLKDERIYALAAKVKLSVDPVLDAMFPAAVPGRVRVTVGGRTLEAEAMAPKGEFTNPMSWDELTAKLSAISNPRLGEARTVDMISALLSLRDQSELRPLLVQLSR